MFNLALNNRQDKDPSKFRSGETVPEGSYACTNCGTRVHMEHEGHLYPCPECYGTKFKRG